MRTAVCGLLLGLLAVSAGWAQELITDKAAIPSLSVTGSAEIRERPDLASVTLGVENQAREAAAAIAANNTAMNGVVEAIRKAGVPAREIQTSNFSVFPIYRSRPTPEGGEEQELIGYRVSNLVTVRTEDMGRVGPIIDAGLAAGANRVQGVDFMLKDDLAARSRALQEAAREARTKARALAGALDLELGPVLSVSEGGARVVPLAMEAAFARAAPVPIQPGQVSVTATVNLTYRLR